MFKYDKNQFPVILFVYIHPAAIAPSYDNMKMLLIVFVPRIKSQSAR